MSAMHVISKRLGNKEWLSVQEVAERVGYSANTCRRALRTLHLFEFVERCGEGVRGAPYYYRSLQRGFRI